MCKCKCRKFATSVRAYSNQTEVPLSPNLNSWAVQNSGNTLVVVNSQWILQPGQSVGLGGNEGEIFVGKLYLQFALPTPAPPIPENRGVVMQKFYVDEC
jgi:hypothetical protein